MVKQYPLAEELRGLPDFGELIETADMHRGDMRLLSVRTVLGIAQGLLVFLSAGLVLWRLVGPADVQGWWSTPAAVVGGIYQSQEFVGHDATPFLSKIPILGYLFKNKRVETQNDELLLFITPRIVKS